MNQNLFIVNESFVLFQLKTNRNEKKRQQQQSHAIRASVVS